MSVELPFTFVNNTPADADEVNANFSTVVNALNSHLQEINPHGITPQQIGAETPTGAQQKATDALNAAKTYTDQQVATRAAITHSHGADDLPKASITAQGIVQLTNSRISRSETVALTARAMDDHRLSGDHDVRYYTKNQLIPIIQYLLLHHWATPDSGTSSDLRDVAYTNDLWVVVGDNGVILTSTNGISWITPLSGTTSNLRGVAYANGLWVVVGESGTISISRVLLP